MIDRVAGRTIRNQSPEITFRGRGFPGHIRHRRRIGENLAGKVCPYCGVRISAVIGFCIGIDHHAVGTCASGIEHLVFCHFLGVEISAEALVMMAFGPEGQGIIHAALEGCEIGCVSHHAVRIEDFHGHPVFPFLEISAIGIGAAADRGCGDFHTGFCRNDIHVCAAEPVSDLASAPIAELGVCCGRLSGASGFGIESGDGCIIITGVLSQIPDIVKMDAVNIIMGDQVHKHIFVPRIGSGMSRIKNVIHRVNECRAGGVLGEILRMGIHDVGRIAGPGGAGIDKIGDHPGMNLDPLGMSLVDEFQEGIKIRSDISGSGFSIGCGWEIIGVSAEANLGKDGIIVIIFRHID